MQDVIKIGVVGAGETGTPLLARLIEAPFIELVGVADLDLTQPGIALAKAHVTGVPMVCEQLRHYMQETGNDHTLIMHERIAILLLSLFSGRLVRGKHGDLEYH